ncbi:flagellar hook-length control protein FliK [Marinomonas sp. C2222]|uniref:Flagellar hook-length control protein FliK n=1 Tax=Marinomonas sargassi TaxID=2984494 RepID=A0ABT2YN98_9GAMM|nr:flagellar hook-length control protein FliK [Marinomonas sargassi]MCV2401366.1 flagellar hook-length control protein FliK [Marinomonas sargassi]
MFSDISSLLNASKSQQANHSSALSNTGTLAKLFSEIKLIDSLSLIRFQGSEVLQQQGKPIQLLHAVGPKQPFTIINSGTPINLDNVKTAELSKTGNNTATLTTTQNTTPNQVHDTKAAINSRIENLTLASRVLNLTVVSTPIPSTSENTIPKTQPNQTPQQLAPQTPQAIAATNNKNTVMPAGPSQTNIQVSPASNSAVAQPNTPLLAASSNTIVSSTTPSSTAPSNTLSSNTATLTPSSTSPTTPNIQQTNIDSTLSKTIDTANLKTPQSAQSVTSPPSQLSTNVPSTNKSPDTAVNQPMQSQSTATPPVAADNRAAGSALTPPTIQNTNNQPVNNLGATPANPSNNAANPSSQTTNISTSAGQQVNIPNEAVNKANTPIASSQTNNLVSATANNMTPSNAHGPSYLATVTDGKTEFHLVSQNELKRGEVIRVFVDANNNLQVLPSKNQSEVTPPQFEALKQSLPKKLPFNDMSQLIKALHTVSESPALPTQTQAALGQLLRGIPNLNELTRSPDNMKQAIQNSGLFSESSLLKNNTSQLADDFKLNLSRVKEVQESSGALRLGSIPTEQIANAIERITTSQLRHFPEVNQNTATIYPLHIELPIKNGAFQELVQIEINQDSGTENEQKQERRWLVKLKFDFEETGRFEARSSIQGNKVSVIFVAEERETIQKLQQNMEKLSSQLKSKDIEVERLDTFQAQLTNIQKAAQQQRKPLIDVRT